ncbi:membrane-associated protein, putative [Bodo saltans]|uniref:Membrane-associated protein, putative n=1 Tax=Bodo saltans TaxID=75058 RepID=A0A0S4IJW2_BODSA|nr:membrane-associated protein, putative [Bodo saltans]|eukprot:CUE96035.1 membrane-associated protein, putative [Bodo saltans]
MSPAASPITTTPSLLLLAFFALCALTSVATVAVVAESTSFTVGNSRLSYSRIRSVPTVPSINMTAYLGTWYPTYYDSFNANIDDLECAQSKYGMNRNGTIHVRNFEGQRSDARVEEGYAYQTDADAYPGRLAVMLPHSTLSETHWIVHLGPILNDEYAYAIVTDLDKLSVTTYSRDPQMFDDVFGAEAEAFLATFSFHSVLDESNAVPQGASCK